MLSSISFVSLQNENLDDIFQGLTTGRYAVVNWCKKRWNTVFYYGGWRSQVTIHIHTPASNEGETHTPKVSIGDAHGFSQFDFEKVAYDGRSFRIHKISAFFGKYHCSGSPVDQYVKNSYEKHGFRFIVDPNPKPDQSRWIHGTYTHAEIEKLFSPLTFENALEERRTIHADANMSSSKLGDDISSRVIASSNVTLEESFKRRIVKLGLKYESIKNLLDNENVYVAGGLVSQVLLDEEWDDDLHIFALRSDAYDLVREAFHSEIITSGSHTTGSDGKVWYTIRYAEKDCATSIYVHHPNHDRSTVTYEEHVNRVQRMTIEDACNIFEFDYLKTSFDGTQFKTFYPQALFEKCHRGDSEVPIELSKKYAEFGFKVSGGTYRERSSIAFESIATIAELNDGIQEENFTSPTPSSSASNVVTLNDGLKKRIEALGINYTKLIEFVISIKGCIVGSVVTQALLEEDWDVDSVRIITSLEDADDGKTLDGHTITTRTSVDRFGWVWYETTYSGVWPTPVSVYRPSAGNNNRKMSDQEATRALLDVAFLRNRFDGTSFHVGEFNSLIERRHYMSVDNGIVGGKVTEVFCRLGFQFTSTYVLTMTNSYHGSLPRNIVSRKKNWENIKGNAFI
jgi:hypothetical protein